MHIGLVIKGEFKLTDITFTKINFEKRKKIENNHTAIHLLNSAISKILKINTTQKGSLVTDKYIRLDFSYKNNISLKKIHKIEQLINNIIVKNLKIKIKRMSLIKSKQQGAKYLSYYNYKKKVRVIIVKSFSIELCKGTHTNYTGNIGFLKINSELSISSGIRRIEAQTGNIAISKIQKNDENIQYCAKILKTNKDNYIEKILQFKKKNKILKRKIQKIKEKEITEKIEILKKKTLKINNNKILFSKIKYKNHKILRKIIISLKKNLKLNSIIILHNNDKNKKNKVIISVTKKLTKKITANKIINKIIKKTNGKGGGNKELAEGIIFKRKNKQKLFKKIKKWIIKKIKD